ncbi:MAG: hypothetical protein EXS37_02955 [Opitutus sp.]|nr:hypothetical protein [Opitutus sp.]
MKIALVTETLPPENNGVAMTFGVIARELGRRGHAVTVYRPRRDDLPVSESATEYAVVALFGLPIPRYPMLRLGLPDWRTLRRDWTADRPDLVHVATEGLLGSSAVSVARELGVPVTSSFHTNFHAYTRHDGFAPLGRAVLVCLRRVHNRTQRMFAPTVERCDELTAARFRQLALLSRGVDTWQFHPSRRAPELRMKWRVEADTPVEAQSWEPVIARLERDLSEVAGLRPAGPGVPVIA